jgi:short chain dehydrogenase
MSMNPVASIPILRSPLPLVPHERLEIGGPRRPPPAPLGRNTPAASRASPASWTRPARCRCDRTAFEPPRVTCEHVRRADGDDPGDNTDPQHRNTLIEALQAIGGLDVLVNNAGLCDDRTIKEQSFDDLVRVIDVNLISIFDTCWPTAALLLAAPAASVIIVGRSRLRPLDSRAHPAHRRPVAPGDRWPTAVPRHTRLQLHDRTGPGTGAPSAAPGPGAPQPRTVPPHQTPHLPKIKPAKTQLSDCPHFPLTAAAERALQRPCRHVVAPPDRCLLKSQGLPAIAYNVSPDHRTNLPHTAGLDSSVSGHGQGPNGGAQVSSFRPRSHIPHSKLSGQRVAHRP